MLRLGAYEISYHSGIQILSFSDVLEKEFLMETERNRVGLGVLVSLLVVLLASSVLGAQSAEAAGIEVTVEELGCLPIAENGIGWATVKNNISDTSVRLYLRRMHEEVEDFYFVEMNPAGEGRYWGIFPEAEDERLERINLEDDDLLEEFRDKDMDDDEDYLWAWWWQAKEASDDRDPNGNLDTQRIRERASVGKLEPRHWLTSLDDPTLQRWLQQLENEPTEFFAAVYDSEGRRVARSRTQVVEVKEECEVELTPQQEGESENLTVGETAGWQRGENVFHWLCDGIVTRVDPYDVLRADESCRGCVIAWWHQRGLILAAPVACAGGFCTPDESPISPFTR
jgi:hypothetical protein